MRRILRMRSPSVSPIPSPDAAARNTDGRRGFPTTVCLRWYLGIGQGTKRGVMATPDEVTALRSSGVRLFDLAATAVERGDKVEAVNLFEQVLVICDETGDLPG